MKLLRHVVLFTYKNDVSDSAIDEVNTAFASLNNEIAEIADFEWGLNNSPEGIAQGFTHGYLLTFKSEADREVYLVHPKHKAFQQLVDPKLAQVLAFDYWTQ